MDDSAVTRPQPGPSDPCLLCQLPSTSKDTPAQQCLCPSHAALPACETTPVAGAAPEPQPALTRKRKVLRTRAANASKKQLFRQESSSDSQWETVWVVNPCEQRLSSYFEEDDEDDDDDDEEEMKRLSSPAAETSPGEGEASMSAEVEESVKTKRRKKKVKLAGRHVCRVCSKVFGSPGKLSQHMYAHTGEKPFECVECPKAFSSKFKLVRHHLIHSEERQYRCSMCERTFHRKDHLKNHLKVHSPVKKTFRCDRPNCVKVYSSYLSYRKHTAFHAAEEGHLDCKMCGKSFSTKEQIEYHLKVHSGSRTVKNASDKKFSCSHCDRKFFTRKDVRRHLVVHTGKRDFLCQFCPQRFGRKDHLVRHIKKSHSVLRTAASRGKRVTSPVSTETSATICQSDVSRRECDVELVQGPDDLFSSVDSVLSTAASSSSSNQLLLDKDGKATAYQIVEHIKQEPSLSPLSHVNILDPVPVFKMEQIKQEVTPVAGSVASLIPVYTPQPPCAYPEELGLKEESEATGLDIIMSVGQIDAAVKVVPSPISPLLPSLEENHYLSSESTAAAETETEPVLPASEFLTQLSAEEVFRLLNTDLSANSASLPLPRFNQAFQQQPPP